MWVGVGMYVVVDCASNVDMICAVLCCAMYLFDAMLSLARRGLNRWSKQASDRQKQKMVCHSNSSQCIGDCFFGFMLLLLLPVRA